VVPGELALSAIFFASGAAGLVFEIVWFYRCGLVFGNSVWAASIVLSSFMGGLAIGNGLVGWHGRRVRSPLRVYATAEFVVAGSGVALAYILSASATLIVPRSRLLLDNFWLSSALRLLTTFTALLVPATAMGATLPLLVSEMCRWRAGFGTALGRLYGWNTLGAVCGALSAEVVLIQRFGVTGTAWMAGLLNSGAGVAALWLARKEAGRGVQVPVKEPPVRLRVLKRPRLVLAAAFASGGALLTLEVVWFRFLSMYVLTTTLALSLMLAVVLTAIGCGGLAMSKWLAGAPRAVGHLPSLSLAAGCAVIVSYGSFQSLTHGTQVGEWYRVLWFACVLTFPTALLSGAVFTLLGETLARDIGVPGRAAAWLTVANTAGSMCGPLLASFVLLPGLGMERSLFVLALCYAIVALLTTLALDAGDRRARRPVMVTAALAFLAASITFPFGLMGGTYFTRAAEAYGADGSEIVATREGQSEAIFLMQQVWLGKPVYHRLVTNGFSMSGTAIPAVRYMRDFVYLPMLVHPSPLGRVLVVCYGVGVTAGAVTDIDSVESIDVVEISRDVVAMSDLIYSSDEHPLHDPRVRLHLEDGRFFLATTSDRFDLITGEPPPPRTPGAVNIYTREYFRLIHDRLAGGGMTTYWLPVGRPDPGTDVNTIVRAFCDVFEDCSLWNATPFDLMLLGSRQVTGEPNAAAAPGTPGGPVSGAGLARAWSRPRLAPKLREIGFERPEQIGATFIGDSAYLRELTTDTPPLTDDYPQRLRPDPVRASLSDPRYRDDPAVAELYRRVIDPDRARDAFARSPLIRRLFPARLIADTLPFFDQQRMINRVLLEGGRPLALIDDLDAVLTGTSLRTLPLWILGSDDVKQRIAATGDDGAGAVAYTRGLQALAAREYLGAVSAFTDADARGFRGATLRPLVAYALYRGGRIDAARELARGAQPRGDDEVHFWNWLRGRAQ
jgi:spermidine synthase